MASITFSLYWNLYLTIDLFYIFLTYLILLYVLPMIGERQKSTALINSSNITRILHLFVPLFLLLFNQLSGSSSLLWFGHFTAANYVVKHLLLLVLTFYIISGMYLNFSVLISREMCDFLISCFQLCLWFIIFYAANTFFALVFVIELIASLILLLLATSVFSVFSFYGNLTSFNAEFVASKLTSYAHAVIFFFWISMISSLNFFLFLLLFLKYFLTTEWFLLEHVFDYVKLTSTNRTWMTFFLIWFFLLFSFFLKCGLVPFFLWKPFFFKNIPVSALTFYILFYYFFLFLFLVRFLIELFSSIFWTFLLTNALLLTFGILLLCGLLVESSFIKSFLALSSILNSLFLFLIFCLPSFSISVLI